MPAVRRPPIISSPVARTPYISGFSSADVLLIARDGRGGGRRCDVCRGEGVHWRSRSGGRPLWQLDDRLATRQRDCGEQRDPLKERFETSTLRRAPAFAPRGTTCEWRHAAPRNRDSCPSNNSVEVHSLTAKSARPNARARSRCRGSWRHTRDGSRVVDGRKVRTMERW